MENKPINDRGIKMMLVNLILSKFLAKAVRLIIGLTFPIGIILAIIISWHFILLALIPFIYALGIISNIPGLSYIARSLNWSKEKESTLKSLSDNPLATFPLAVYLETNKEMKNIYIKKGKKAYAQEVIKFFDSMRERIDKQFEILGELDLNDALKSIGENTENLPSEDINNVLKKISNQLAENTIKPIVNQNHEPTEQ